LGRCERRNINDLVKGRLFEAFVSSVLLYNAEVWPLRPEELKRLKAAYSEMVIQLARRGGKLRGRVNMKLKDALAEMGLPELERLLTQKRLRWVGHALRREGGDASREAVLYELRADNEGTWAQLVRGDMKAMRWQDVEALQVAVTNRAQFKASTDARSRPSGAP
jgi:hypothetical protein